MDPILSSLLIWCGGLDFYAWACYFLNVPTPSPTGQFSTDCELVGAERLSFVCQEFSLASAGICLCVVVWLNVCVRERGLQKCHEWKMDALVCMGHCLNTGGEQSLNPGVMVLTIRPPHPPLPLPPPHTPSFPVGQLEERSDGSSSVAGAGAGPGECPVQLSLSTPPSLSGWEYLAGWGGRGPSPKGL